MQCQYKSHLFLHCERKGFRVVIIGCVSSYSYEKLLTLKSTLNLFTFHAWIIQKQLSFFSTVYIIVNRCKLDQRNAVRTRLWLKTLLRISLEEIKEERGRWLEGEHNKKNASQKLLLPAKKLF